MKLIITRHGETEENKAGILQGHLPGTLSAKGIKQAKKVAMRLKDEKIDSIFSSDLARASDTAKEIAKYHPKTSLKFVKDLRERDFGEFQGKNKSEFDFGNRKHIGTLIQPKHGETLEEVYNRTKRFLYKTLSEHYRDTVLFVAHGAFNKVLVGVITGKKIEDIPNIHTMENASITIFDIDKDKKYKKVCYSCTKHFKSS